MNDEKIDLALLPSTMHHWQRGDTKIGNALSLLLMLFSLYDVDFWAIQTRILNWINCVYIDRVVFFVYMPFNAETVIYTER